MPTPKPPRRHVGQYVASGDWSDYWTTRISRAESGKIRVRGYPIEELIEHLSYSESAFLLLRGELPDEREAALFDLALRSGMDQQFISSAACAARYTASAFPDSPIPALASGILASGSVTGSAQEPAAMLIEAAGWRLSDEEAAARAVDVWLERRSAVPGLGHPMHKQAEPRAVTLRRIAVEQDGWRQHGGLLDAIESELEGRKGRPIPMNLAGALGALLADLGFDPLVIGGLGALSYSMALLAHISEEVRVARRTQRAAPPVIHPYAHYPARAARRWPDRVALVDGERRRSYRELDERATRLARALIELGLEPGERIAVVQENRIEYVETVIAIARAGGVLVPLLGALTEAEHAFMVRDAEARFVVALGAEAISRAKEAAGRGASVIALAESRDVTDLASLADAESTEMVCVDRSPDSLAQILYTSGTTGHPKGVTHSLASVAAAMGAWATAFSVGPDDRLLGQLALSHFGGRAMDSCWVAGATLVILPAADPKTMLAAIAEHGVTMILVIPTLLRMLLDHPDAASAELSSLRAVVYAAAPAAPALVRRSIERLGPVLYTGFGQTEAYGLNTFMDPAEHVAALEAGGERLTSVGHECAAFAQVRICDDEGSELPAGEIGEICVSAPWVTPGFWRRPELDRERLRDGWLRTGDLARMDAEGYVFLADRKEDKIITGGFNVYPAEIEGALAEHSAVAECAVFAIPDPKWGEAVRAAVTLRPGHAVDSEELIDFCKQHLARFKVPKAIDVLEELPKSGVGKILRRALREPWWKNQERGVHGAE